MRFNKDNFSFIIGLLFSIITIVLGLYKYSDYDYLKKVEFTRISGVLLENPRKAVKSSDIYLKLKDYPEYNFTSFSIANASTYSWFLIDNVIKGDTLFLDITISDYRKIIDNPKPEFLDYIVTVYGISDDEYVYLSLEDSISDNNKNVIFIVFFFPIVGCLLGLYLIYDKISYP